MAAETSGGAAGVAGPAAEVVLRTVGPLLLVAV